jgi:hypothetical protein
MDQLAIQVAFVSSGRRSLEVLNKSAIVLLCAIWEAARHLVTGPKPRARGVINFSSGQWTLFATAV